MLTCLGYSPLHLAVLGGHLAVVKLLVAAKADVNQPDGRSGRVALHHAAEDANVGITGFLVLEVSSYHGHSSRLCQIRPFYLHFSGGMYWFYM